MFCSLTGTFRQFFFSSNHLVTPSSFSSAQETGARFRDANSVCAQGGIPDLREMVVKSMEEYEEPKNLPVVRWKIDIFAEFMKNI